MTVWTTGAIATRAYGEIPSALDLLLLLSGAVAGFGLVSTYAVGTRGRLTPGTPSDIRVWGGLHIPSVGLSIALVTGMSHLVDNRCIWPLAGFVGTATYLLVAGIQFTLARR